jgi:hypothetical protein
MSRTTAWLRSAALLGAASLLATGCSEEVDASAHRGDQVRAGQEYVALGDSYVAGPGLGENVGPAVCTRTTGNYPHRLAERLDLELVDASCGGATTDHLEDEQEVAGQEVPPQLDALSKDTRLVTLGIGANNDGVFSTSILVCAQLADRDPDGSPCADEAAKSAGEAEAHIDALEEEVTEAVAEIQERSPEARIVLVGYPQILPASGWCQQAPLARGDYAFVRRMLGLLNEALRGAANRADVEYVDVAAVSKGHDICSTDPWVAGRKPTRPAHPFHPYAAEAEAVADLLTELVGKTDER